MKILFVATYPTQATGYARIGNKITNFLASKEGVKVYYFGFQNYNGMKVEREYHPNIEFIDVEKEEKAIGSKEIFGVDIIKTWMDKIRPDVLFIYNDIIVISRIYNELIEYRKQNNYYKTVTYLDLVYDYEKYEYIHHMNRHSDLIFVFTEHWKENLVKMGLPENKIKIFYHGFDDKLFFKMDKQLARSKIGLENDDFIVLNTNRNSYRKGLDITIFGFLEFLKMNDCKSNIKLFLNNLIEIPEGYDIMQTIRVGCIKYDLDFDKVTNNHILRIPQSSGLLSDEKLNEIYNSCDVGVNSCIGEGFGLCNMEQACLGKPQIISHVGGLRDLFKEDFCIKVEPKCIISLANSIDGHNGDVGICDSRDFALAMNYYYHNPEKRLSDGENVEKIMRERCNWKVLLDQFYYDFIQFYYSKN